MSKTKAQERLMSHIRSRYTRITVKSEQGLFNYKCFYNAVEYALANPDTEVWEVVYIENECPVLHYINKRGDEWLETSVGFLADQLEYYPIRKIVRDDWRDIQNVFIRSLDAWREDFCSWWDKYMLRVERVV